MNMLKRDKLTQSVAAVGTAPTWLPLLAPLVLSFLFFLAEGRFLLDYLMPAELFFVALASGLLPRHRAGHDSLPETCGGSSNIG
jgi:hypothetical protein